MMTRMIARDGRPAFSVEEWCRSVTSIFECPHCHARNVRAGTLIVERKPHRLERGFHDEIVAVTCASCGAESDVTALESTFGDTYCPRCASGPANPGQRHIVHTSPPYKREDCAHCGELLRRATRAPFDGLDWLEA